MRRYGLILLVWLAVLCSAAGAQSLRFDFSPSPIAEKLKEKPDMTMAVPRLPSAPRIDGKLDDAAWRRAKTFRFNRGNPTQTGFIGYHGNELYVAVRCKERPGSPAVAKEDTHDGGVWKDDCIEMWIMPNRKQQVSYQFDVNVANVALDAVRLGRSVEAGYNPEWRHATSRGKGEWTVEVAIPCSAVRMAEWLNGVGFNIGCNGPHMRARSWNPYYGRADRSVVTFEGVDRQVVTSAADEAPATISSNLVREGDSLLASLERFETRPGDRWLEVELRLKPRASLGRAQVKASLFTLGGARPVEQASVRPTRDSGRLLVDLRRKGIRKGELLLELTEDGRRTGLVKALISAAPPALELKPNDRFAVMPDVPPGVDAPAQWPVTFGAPFPAGALWDANDVRLVDEQDREVPCQKEVMSTWGPEGAVQWLRFDALVNPKRQVFVERRAASARPGDPVKLTRRGGDVVIETAGAKYVLATGASPIREVWRNGSRVAASAGARGLYVIDRKGRLGAASAKGETMKVESSGPVAACVRFEGDYRDRAGKRMARHITRVEVFAGQPFARVTHTLVITEDSDKLWFKDIGWEFAVAPGSGAAALFGSSARDSREVKRAPLSGRAVAFMLQDEHFVYNHGKNHALIGIETAPGRVRKLHEGVEIGDWAALIGSRAGLMVSCRDAALQHPKEFQASADRLCLKLFSPRGGDELSFRVADLMKVWNVEQFYSKRTQMRYKRRNKRDLFADMRKQNSNAVGWSKTHSLTLCPLAPSHPEREAARLSCLTSKQVYAHVSPKWIYASRVFGPLHPKDRKRFSLAEKFIDLAFQLWVDRVEKFGEFGFLYYYTGPHLAYPGGKPKPMFRRYRLTYTLRPDLWLAYARSSDRSKRAFAERVNAAFMDSVMCHWPSRGKTQGFYVGNGGEDRFKTSKSCLPLYWEGRTVMQISSSTNLNQFLWYYYLTGYRRARDVVLQYGDGMKKAWTPSGVRSEGRVIQAFRCLTHLYGLTWDPVYRAMAVNTMDFIHDPDTEVKATKDRPYRSTTYKLRVDVASLIEGYEVFGTQRLLDIATAVAKNEMRYGSTAYPVTYTNPTGRAGAFLYGREPDPRLAQDMRLKLRRAMSVLDPDKNVIHDFLGAHQATYVFEGIPYTQHVLTQAGAVGRDLTSWIGYEDYGNPVTGYLYKKDGDIVNLTVKNPRRSGHGKAGDRVAVSVTGTDQVWGLDLNRVCDISQNVTQVRIPKDAPESPYKLESADHGSRMVLADAKVPLVFHAPDYWRPFPPMRPRQKVFFTLPKNSKDAQLFLEGKGALVQPDGKPFQGGKALTGWVDLPAGKPGLWTLNPHDHRLVRVRNLPPVFAMGEADNFFMPPVSWGREAPKRKAKPVPKGTVYVDGAIERPGDKALYVAGRRLFTMLGGGKTADGTRERFLPFKRGTIEFFLKPNWSTFDRVRALKRRATVPVLALRAKHGWSLSYWLKPDAEPGLYNQTLYAQFMSDGRSGLMTMRVWRQRTLFEADEWVHVAWVWGPEAGASWRAKGKPTLITRLFVNGKAGTGSRHYRWPGNEALYMPTALSMAGRLEGAVDELRVSNAQRYKEDFQPPSRKAPTELDADTLVLFRFNGDVKPETPVKGPPPVVKLRK